MIVEEAPYDLVALFADQDTQRFFEELLERGQHPRRRCSRPFRWRSVRDPRRDTVWREPESALRPFFGKAGGFLVVWDRHGSGVGKQTRAAEVEAAVVEKLVRSGIPEGRALAVELQPELEVVFRQVWSRVKQEIASERGSVPPTDRAIHERLCAELETDQRKPNDLEEAFAHHPKEVFEALVREVRLRRSAVLYGKIGRRVSLPQLKKHDDLARVSDAIAEWFPFE